MREAVGKGKRSRSRGFVTAYLVTCSVTGQKYIGICAGRPETRWTEHCRNAKNGSKCWLHAAIRNYGREAFTVESIASAKTWEDACLLETVLIAQHDTFWSGNYNMTPGGDGGPTICATEEAQERRRESGRKLGNMPKSPEQLAKIGAANATTWTPERRAEVAESARIRMEDAAYKANLMASHATPDYREKMGNKARGRIATDAQREARSLSQTGKKLSQETRSAMSAAHTGAPYQRSEQKSLKCRQNRLGRKATGETRARISAAQIGRKQTPETIAKRSAALRGHVVSQETRDKISAANLRRRTQHQQAVGD